MMVGGPRATLSNGQSMPLLGLGTASTDGDILQQTIEAALRMGYRHIDTAQMYKNHVHIGKVFARMFAAGGELNRKDCHITSKLDNGNHASERVAPACRETLEELQLQYLDLFLMHWPVTGNKGPVLEPPIKDTWQAMEKLVDEGLVRAIGVSNFSIKKLQDLLSYARIQPVVNQIECHPYLRNQANIDFCRSKGILVTAYSPLGSPKDAALSENKRGNMPILLHDKVVQGIADKHGKHPAQVLVRWALQHGTAVVPRASGEAHLRSNLGALDWELPPEDFQALSSFEFQARMVDGHLWLEPEGPYKTIDELWDGEVPEENRVP